MSFTKNWIYDSDGNVVVKTEKGEPHYREQADLIFEEIDSGVPKKNKYRIIKASAAAEAENFFAHDDGGNNGVKFVSDVNRVADNHPDFVIIRIDKRGEGRVYGSTNWRKTDWKGGKR